MLHCPVASDSPGGATSNSKVSKLAYYRHVHCILALMCEKIVATFVVIVSCCCTSYLRHLVPSCLCIRNLDKQDDYDYVA